VKLPDSCGGSNIKYLRRPITHYFSANPDSEFCPNYTFYPCLVDHVYGTAETLLINSQAASHDFIIFYDAAHSHEKQAAVNEV